MESRAKQIIEEFKRFVYYVPEKKEKPGSLIHRYESIYKTDPEYIRFESFVKGLCNKKGLINLEDGELDRYVLENNITFDIERTGHIGHFGVGRWGNDESIFSIFINSVNQSKNPIFSLIIHFVPRYFLTYYHNDYEPIFTQKDPIVSTLMFFLMRSARDKLNYNNFTEYLCSNDIEVENIIPYLEEDYSLSNLMVKVTELSVKLFGDNYIDPDRLERGLSRLRFNIVFDTKCNVKIRKDDFLIGINAFCSHISSKDFNKFDFVIDDDCVIGIMTKGPYNEWLYRYILDNDKMSDPIFLEKLKESMEYRTSSNDRISSIIINELEEELSKTELKMKERKQIEERNKRLKEEKKRHQEKKVINKIKTIMKRVGIKVKNPSSIITEIEKSAIKEKSTTKERGMKKKKHHVNENNEIANNENCDEFKTNIMKELEKQFEDITNSIENEHKNIESITKYKFLEFIPSGKFDGAMFVFMLENLSDSDLLLKIKELYPIEIENL